MSAWGWVGVAIAGWFLVDLLIVGLLIGTATLRERHARRVSERRRAQAGIPPATVVEFPSRRIGSKVL